MRKSPFLLEQIEKLLRLLSRLASIIGCAALLAMLALVCANIAMRPFGGGIRGTVEMSGYLCALAVGLCLPAAQLAGSHISAGLWLRIFPPRFRLAQQALISLVCAGLLLAVGRELLALAEYTRESGEYIDGFDFSYFGMILGMAIGVALHGLVFVLTFFKILFSRQEAHL